VDIKDENGEIRMNRGVGPDIAHSVASPIADLTYRNYDGPIRTRAVRWWIIAAATLRLVGKKPGFWVVFALCLLPYLLHGLQFYVLESRLGSEGTNLFGSHPTHQKWAFMLYQALNGDLNGICLFAIALIVGSGSIASDNRANALLVYLSKPITKGDYLLGKWVGVALAVFGAALVPSLVMWTFMAISYSGEGFFRDDPWLILHLALTAALPAVIHTSMILGFSAWSKSASVAGAVYASVYFLGNTIMGDILGPMTIRDSAQQGVLVQHLSIGGVIDGMAQNILHITEIDSLRMYASRPEHFGGPPAFWPVAAMGAALALIGVVAARAKIRAVEVIRG